MFLDFHQFVIREGNDSIILDRSGWLDRLSHFYQLCRFFLCSFIDLSFLYHDYFFEGSCNNFSSNSVMQMTGWVMIFAGACNNFSSNSVMQITGWVMISHLIMSFRFIIFFIFQLYLLIFNKVFSVCNLISFLFAFFFSLSIFLIFLKLSVHILLTLYVSLFLMFNCFC